MVMELWDTIVALATPAGRGGIGVVRVSGAEARALVGPLLRLGGAELVAGRARLTAVVNPASGVVVDEAVVTYFAAPHSYTTEDVVELACHGAPVLLDWVVRALVARGARPARAGEFTERAFLAGRLDLAQAEAVHALVAARTMEQARVAAAQLGGALSLALAGTKEALLNLIAELEAGVDFVEDDLDLLPDAEVAGRVRAVLTPVDALAGTYRAGRVLREGFRLAIVGRPNAGKSSLFNRLLGRERAIVTAQPGTTRDVVSETMALDGVPVELVDTAGLREAPAGAEGEAERAGIARTGVAIAEAELVALVVDASTLAGNGLGEEDAAVLARLTRRPHVLVLNKCDLAPEVRVDGAVRTSALTGEGLDALRAAILREVRGPAMPGESAMVTNQRQHGLLEEAVAALQSAAEAAGRGVPQEMVLLDLYGALKALDAVTGQTGDHEVLHRIFVGFCVGK